VKVWQDVELMMEADICQPAVQMNTSHLPTGSVKFIDTAA